MDRRDDRTLGNRWRSSPRFAATSSVLVLSMCAVMLTGTLVPGVECPTLRTDDGKTIALSHVPGAAFAIGDRVTVTGSGYGASMSCQQEVLLVTKVEAAK